MDVRRGREDRRLGLQALGARAARHRLLQLAGERSQQAGALRTALEPPTFLVPDDEAALLEAAALRPEAVWIEKARQGPRAQNVWLLPGALDARRNRTTLVQRYVDRPHLLDGRKWTVRLCALVLSARPLHAFALAEPLVELAARAFLLDAKGRADRARHLTAPDLPEAQGEPDAPRALPFAELRARLDGAAGPGTVQPGNRAAALLERLQQMAREVLAAAQGAADEPRPNSFELVALDFAVDAELRPWLVGAHLDPPLDEAAARAAEALVDLPGAPGPGAPAEQWAARQAALLARRGPWAPLVPGPEALALLPLLPSCGPADLALALAGRTGAARALRAADARAFPLRGEAASQGAPSEQRARAAEEGALLHVAGAPEPALLSAAEARAWEAVRGGSTPEQVAAALAPADEAEALAALARFAHLGAVRPADAPPPSPAAAPASAPVAAAAPRWNREPHFEVEGLRLSLRLADDRWEALVLPTLAWARCADDRPPDARIEAQLDEGRLVLADEAGFALAVPTLDRLAATVHALALRRSALQRGLVGALRAAVLQREGRGALVLGAPRDWLDELPRDLAVSSLEPALIGRSALAVWASRRPGAPSLPVHAVVHLRRDLDAHGSVREEPRARALQRVLDARLAPAPPLSEQSAGALARWIGELQCRAVRAPDAHAAGELLRGLL